MSTHSLLLVYSSEKSSHRKLHDENFIGKKMNWKIFSLRNISIFLIWNFLPVKQVVKLRMMRIGLRASTWVRKIDFCVRPRRTILSVRIEFRWVFQDKSRNSLVAEKWRGKCAFMGAPLLPLLKLIKWKIR